MNIELLQSFAQRLAREPQLLADAEEKAIRSLLLSHSTGLLYEETARQADELIATDPQAAAIWAEFQETDEHLKTKAGKDWLNATRDRLLERVAHKKPQLRSGVGGSVEVARNLAPPPAIEWHQVYFAGWGIAADSNQSSPRIFKVDGESLILLLLPHADGEHLTVEVYTSAYQTSSELDGSILLVGESRFLIENGSAVTPLETANLIFGLITKNGDNIALQEQS